MEEAAGLVGLPKIRSPDRACASRDLGGGSGGLPPARIGPADRSSSQWDRCPANERQEGSKGRLAVCAFPFAIASHQGAERPGASVGASATGGMASSRGGSG